MLAEAPQEPLVSPTKAQSCPCMRLPKPTDTVELKDPVTDPDSFLSETPYAVEAVIEIAEAKATAITLQISFFTFFCLHFVGRSIWNRLY